MTLSEMSFLEQYDNAADAEKFPLVHGWIVRTPLPFFDELRTRRPIFETSVATLLARQDDVYEVLRLPAIFTVKLYEPSVGEYMLALDGTPIHTREKGIMYGMLNRDDMPGLRKRIGQWSSDLLDSAGGQLDLVDGYARKVPITVVQKYFGLDGIDPLKQIEWSYRKQIDTFHNQPYDVISDQERERIRRESNEAGAEMKEYLGQLIVRRLNELQSGSEADDIVSRMLRTQFPEEVGFPMERLARNVGGLLVGAVETTSQAVVQTLQEILRRPDVTAQAIRAAQEASLDRFDAIVWEALRFNPIAPFLPRLAVQDYVVARGTEREILIRAGTRVLALVWSAMFDPTLFPDPYTFQPDRPFENYFHFGHGLHECLGKYVGMVMIPEMVRQVLVRPNVAARSAVDFKGTPYPQEYQVAWGEPS